MPHCSLRRTALVWATAAALLPLTAAAQAPAKLKVGLMLLYSGTYDATGNATENGV